MIKSLQLDFTDLGETCYNEETSQFERKASNVNRVINLFDCEKPFIHLTIFLPNLTLQTLYKKTGKTWVRFHDWLNIDETIVQLNNDTVGAIDRAVEKYIK